MDHRFFPSLLAVFIAATFFCLTAQPSQSQELTVELLPSYEYHHLIFDGRKIEKLQSLLGERDPIVIQLRVDPLVYTGRFADSFQLLNSYPKECLTPYLLKLHGYCEHRLAEMGDYDNPVPTSADPQIQSDLIYRLLKNGKWDAAMKLLERLQKHLEREPNRELSALCDFYKGMMLAESGVARFFDAYPLFSNANRIFDECAKENEEKEKTLAESRFRVAFHCGDYLVQLTRYRISNYAIAVGVGDDVVFTDAWLSWSLALDMYGKSLRIAEQYLADQPELIASARIGLARLYALRGDIARTIKREKQDKQDLNIFADVMAVEDISYEQAANLAEQALALAIQDDRLNGEAHHVLATVAYRHKDFSRCRTEAETARNLYVRSGKISSIATIEMLLANICIGDTSQELKHLLVSEILSETLREQLPMDEIGLNRAGFMARRAFSKERLLELLIKENRSVEALAVLENAKGRSLQDALMDSSLQAIESGSSSTKSIEEIIAGIPDGMAVLEYYIGRSQCWCFLILNRQVRVFPIEIQDRSDPMYGKPRPSKEIINLVQQCVQKELSGSVSPTRAPMSMTEQMRSQREGRGFSRRWQNSLQKLRTWLLPDPILDEIRTTNPESLLIVPHHILHYLPFAALVNELDTESEDRRRMPQPKFLIDESFTLFYAPSLVCWDTIRRHNNRPFEAITTMGISEFSYGVPLPGVKNDILNAQNAFGKKNVKVFMENDVTQTAVLNELRQRGLLLIGTHGVNNSLYPLYSFLVLRSEVGEDASLTAEEIFRCRIQKDVVVLSACYSGLAEKSPLPCDDLFGIQRAMLQGGAGAVIAGMWDVYDMTGPEIIGGMMKHLVAKKSIARALAESQREFLNHARNGEDNVFVHPYFWAVYTLSGNGQIQYQTAQ